MTGSAIIASEIARYAEERPGLSANLAIFHKLWELQDEIADGAPGWSAPDLETMHEALVTGQTIFSIDPPGIPEDAFSDAVKKIADVFSSSETIPAPAREDLASADLEVALEDAGLDDAVLDVDALVSRVFEALDADEDDASLGPVEVGLVVTSALTPFLTSASRTALEALGEFDWRVWDSGRCPVCGSPASSGRIIDAGELEGDFRFLSCPLCRAEWGYDRLRCPRCGGRDHPKLRFFFDEDDPSHRVHTCDSCHGYIVVTDERESRHQGIPQVEEVVMLALETVAKDRGFRALGDESE